MNERSESNGKPTEAEIRAQQLKTIHAVLATFDAILPMLDEEEGSEDENEEE